MPLLTTTRAPLLTAGLAALLAAALPNESRAQGSGLPLRKDAPAVDGQKVFSTTCAACHQADAGGVPEKYPPLAGSEWVTGDARRMLRIVLFGLTGDVDVAGETYSGAMPGWGPTLGDVEIAAVTTYVRSHFGNQAPPVTPAAVAKVRQEFAGRTTPWTAAELEGKL